MLTKNLTRISRSAEEKKDSSNIQESSSVQDPWLSIIIPVYNAEKYLKTCLQSILIQNFQPFEVIIVDDGSTDRSSEICLKAEKKDHRFHYYRKENGGSFQTRIYGIEQARGKYITFCDADDYYPHKRVFQIIYDHIVQSGCSVLQFNYYKKYNHLARRIRMVEKDYAVDQKQFMKEEYPKLICSFWDSSHLTSNVWNKVYCRELCFDLPESGKSERIFWGDDLIMNLYLLNNCRSVLYIPEELYVYRQFSGGTSSFSLEDMKDLDLIKRYQLKFLETRDEDKPRLEKIMYFEASGWFFSWVRKALEHVDDGLLKEQIESALQLPSFIKARDYYAEQSNHWGKAAELLHDADPVEYIECAKSMNNPRKSIKTRVFSIAKKILISI